VTDGNFAQGLIGVTLDGRYRLDAVLGVGGMGSVFRATQLAMDRKVAVKLLKPHLTNDEAALQRFAREARATLKVDSPHAVKVLDFGVTPRRDYYMVLEYLDGRTVQRELEIDGPFAPARVAHIARQALHALGAAHRQGLIHRDVKPDNLLLMRIGSDADYTKVLDFGVAKLMQGAAGHPSQLALTAAGIVFGTPEFMSPEQACGQALDGRSDLYSLAVTMFAMLTGVGLFEGRTAIEWMTHHARTPAPRLAAVRQELAAYPELDDVLQRCLAKHCEHRPETAAAMAALIAEIEPTLARSPGAAALVIGATCASGAPTGHASAHAVGRTTDQFGAPAASRTAVFHASSYFPALSNGQIDRAAAPEGVRPSIDSAGSPDTAPAAHRRRRSPRGLYLSLGGVMIASLVGATLGIAVHRSASRSTSMSGGGSQPADPQGAVRAAAPDDAAVQDAAGPAPGNGEAPPVPIDAAHAPSASLPAAVHVPAAVPAAGRNAAAEEHLRSAEDGFRDGKPLKQLAEADLALRSDPSSARARFLLADALIKAGDLDRGCAYLRALKRYPLARDRARRAGCPGD
jgi:hypothetical protein